MTEQQQPQTTGVYSQPTAFTHHIYFDGEISEVNNYREEVAVLRDASPLDTVHMHIETEGGSLYTAKHIISYMKECPAHIITEVKGLCASAGTLIFLSGDEFRLGEFTDFMFHHASYGYSGKANNVAEYVLYQQKVLYSFLHSVYKHFMTVEEIDKLISGSDYWFDTDEIVRRLKVRGEALFEESGEFEPDPEVMSTWSKERLLDFMFNEEYDHAGWEDFVKEQEETKAENNVDDLVWVNPPEGVLSGQEAPDEESNIKLTSTEVYQELRKLSANCWGGDLSEGYVDFYGGCSINNVNELLNDGEVLNVVGLEAKTLKKVATSLGIPYNKNASQKVMSKLILEFIDKVVAILNS